MKLLSLVLGIALSIIGFWMLVFNSSVNAFGPPLNVAALLIGGILINRGITQNRTFSYKSLLKDLVHGKKIFLGIVGVILLIVSVTIVFLGQDKYIGYNKAHDLLVAVLSLVIAVSGAIFLGRYLMHYRKN